MLVERPETVLASIPSLSVSPFLSVLVSLFVSISVSLSSSLSVSHRSGTNIYTCLSFIFTSLLSDPPGKRFFITLTAAP
jgi:hypothetical protein